MMMLESMDVEQGAVPSPFEADTYVASRKAQLEALLLARLVELPPSSPLLVRKALRYSLLAESERRRAVLCLAVAEAVSGARVPPRVVEDAACALELIQTCSQIHEDLRAMDDRALSRGRPSSSRAFGETLATQAGDALILEAFRLLSSGPEPVRARLSRELAMGTGLMGMVSRQVPDLVNDRDARLAYLLQVHSMKTGGFIRASCRMGALAAGADEDTLARVDVYGDAVGLAFLIGDDLRARASDATAETETVAGRITFASVLGLKTSRALAVRKVAEAIAAIEPLEGPDGPLAAIARDALDPLHPEQVQ